MSSATKALQAAKFLSGMYRERARILYWAHVRGDLFSRLILPNHHTDPYQIYEEMRARGPLVPTRLGNYTTTSHRVCNEVLRSRRFGVRPEDGSEDLANQAGLDLSLLELNPQTTPGFAGSLHRPSPRAGWQGTWDWSIKRSKGCSISVNAKASST
jgi:hypothetical protein